MGLKTYRVEVRNKVVAHCRASSKLRNNSKCRQRLEVLVSFECPLQLLLGCADTQVVKDDSAFGVVELDGLGFLLLGGGDSGWVFWIGRVVRGGIGEVLDDLLRLISIVFYHKPYGTHLLDCFLGGCRVSRSSIVYTHTHMVSM